MQDRVHPAALTGQIKEATTIEVLLRMHRAYKSHLNHIHLSACWTSLGQLAKWGWTERRWVQTNAEPMEPLVQHPVRAAQTGEIGARELANVGYGAACSSMGKSLGALFAALARTAQRRVGEFNAQELANTAWAFATADQ